MQDILQQLSPILGNPALWLAVTLVAFIFGQHLYKLTQFNPLFTPIVAVVSIIVVLLVMGVPYEQYFQGAGVIHFLLGPATVVLAVPLFEQRQKLVELWLPLTCGLLAGSVAAIVSVVAFGWLFGLSAETMISMIPKSVTTPIAMGVSEAMGGRPDLTACLVVITGIFGSIVGRVPYFGLVTDEGRKATWIVEVKTTKKPEAQILGSAIGMKVMEDVPYVKGLDKWIGTELDGDAKAYHYLYG